MLTSRKELDAELGGAARAWLDEALAEAAHEAARTDAPGPYASPPWELRYAAAGRHCGPEHADSVRSLLLVEARAPLASLVRLYEQGTAAERRAVLLTLHLLDLGDTALALVEDALRTNDTRLVAAAVGPYAAAHLGPHAWRHAVLKCLFTQVPVASVARLDERARGDAELARMLHDFAAERTAAGRPVPEDLRTVLALTAPPDADGHPGPPTAAPAPTEES
ncbi:EboA domain-containing protein [Streptomyces sp. NPDC059698]|uniref:EboA domain-containing protein n=1 Tax=unclassified Streptomyces TaxID=2593676 RepID=UPI00093EEC61|nr:EboA domain-containing protein [Streptomyces sp. CB02366]OKJ35327.1 sugar phosphate isomerase [Streptomyces sp. CB02366]TVP33744.1 sugar phosphate isomerase [Streptomyces griseus subsp. griseus]